MQAQKSSSFPEIDGQVFKYFLNKSFDQMTMDRLYSVEIDKRLFIIRRVYVMITVKLCIRKIILN